MATYVYARSQGQRTHSARTNKYFKERARKEERGQRAIPKAGRKPIRKKESHYEELDDETEDDFPESFLKFVRFKRMESQKKRSTPKKINNQESDFEHYSGLESDNSTYNKRCERYSIGKGGNPPAGVDKEWDLGMEPLVDAAIEKLKSDHEKSIEKQDQEMRNLLTQDKEDEVESSPRSKKRVLT